MVPSPSIAIAIFLSIIYTITLKNIQSNPKVAQNSIVHDGEDGEGGEVARECQITRRLVW